MARYIRQYNVPQIFQKYSLTIYLLCSALIAIQGYALILLSEGKGKDVISALNHYVYAYNSPLVIISSVAFFMTFVKMRIRQSKTINYTAQSVIAVLLVHASSALNWPMKNYFKGALENDNPFCMIVLWIVGLGFIFAVSVLIDQLRIYSYKLLCPRLIIYIENKMNRYIKQ